MKRDVFIQTKTSYGIAKINKNGYHKNPGREWEDYKDLIIFFYFLNR